MNGNNFGIYIPSYGRAETTNTYKLVEYYKYVVRETQKADYLAAGIPEENIIAVEDSKINSACKVCNWIIENAEEDVFAMLDDDIESFIYRLEKNVFFADPETVTLELERIGQLMYDLEIGYGFVDATAVPWGYSQEFAWKGISGGMRWVNKKKIVSRFDETVSHNADLNIVLNELLVNRICLNPKYLCIKAGTDTNKGGMSEKVRADQVATIELMKKRWGKYFAYNFKTNKPTILVRR